MRFGWTILYVDDVARSLDFYERAFGLETRFLHEGGDFGELETGGTALAFSARRLLAELKKTPGRADPHTPCFEIALVTPDVPAAIERAVAAGAVLIQPAGQTPWGQTIAYVADPDGVLVELCTPVGGADA